MKSGVSAEHTPVDLGRAEAPDPYTVQPGAILLGRFCVIGRVRHAMDSWRVLVTDIHRALGAPPHHRLDLHFVPVDDRLEGVVRLALPAHQRGTRRADALMRVDSGICLLTAPADGPSIELPLPEEEALSVARTLAGVVAGVHKAGVAGIRFDLRELRLDAFGRPQLSTWRHLTSLRMAGPDDHVLEADTRELVDTLCELGSEHVERLLRDVPPRSAAVLERLTQLQPDRKLPSAADVLPAIPPFVGRDLVLLRLHEAVARARHEGPEFFLVSGPDGSGRSRLLAQLAADFERGDGLFTVHVRFSRSQPTSGLAPLMEQVVDRIELLPARDREQCIARIAKSVGPLGGVLQTIGSRIAKMFGPSPPLPDIPLDEKFIRHAATLAEVLSAIGTQNHPLVLLLDDIHEADASIRAVLYHLLTPGRSHHTAIIVTGTAEVELPGNLIHIKLPRLGEAAYAAMLRAALPGQVEAPEQIARLLAEGSNGEPGTAWAILRAWVEEGAIRQDRQGRWVLEHEPTLALLPLRNVWQELSPDARRVGTLVVARAEPIPPDWILQVTGWPQGRANNALEPLLTGSVLVAHPDGMMFWPDDRTAEEFGENASEPEIASAHRAISQWLESPNVHASVALRAFHKEKGAQEGTKDDKLATLHMDAGQLHLDRGDAERAEWHFSRACVRTTNLARTRLALEGRADALLLLDRADEALAAYLASMDGDDDPVRALELANKAVYSFHLRGYPDACATVADRALVHVNERLPRSWAEALPSAARHFWRWLLKIPYAPTQMPDSLCAMLVHLMVGIGTSRPYVGLYSLTFALATCTGRTSVQTARVRAFVGAIFAGFGWYSRMRVLTDRASIEVANSGSDAAGQGFVLHMRGQSELADGNYEVGMSALSDAVSAFRRAGDLSMGAFSLLLAVMYAIDREPAGQLLRRLSELEMVAWRQRNDVVVPALRSTRLWVMVRSGQMTDLASVREVVDAIMNGSNKDSYSKITSHAFCALALTAVGDSAAAVPLAIRGRELLEATFPQPPFLDVARVAEATALIASVASDIDVARRALKKLRTRQHRVPGIRVATRMLSARLAIREGRGESARMELAGVVEDLQRHGEAWRVYEGHQLLATLLAGADAPAARAHGELASELATRLQVVADSASQLTDEQHPNGGSRHKSSRTTLNSLWNAVLPTLPQGLQLVMDDAPLVVVQGDPALLELLLVNLVLAARDISPPEGRVQVESSYAHLTDERAANQSTGSGRWGCIQVRTEKGTTALARGALRECQAVCTDLGGFLEITENSDEVVIRAYVRAVDTISPVPQEVAVVVHREELLRRSLVDALRRAGWTVMEIPAGEQWPDDTAIALVDGRLGNAAVQQSHATVVRVISRAAETPTGPYLRVPYLVKELEDLLGKLKRAPTVPGSQSG